MPIVIAENGKSVTATDDMLPFLEIQVGKDKNQHEGSEWWAFISYDGKLLECAYGGSALEVIEAALEDLRSTVQFYEELAENLIDSVFDDSAGDGFEDDED